jgi:hypothetical protein
MRPVRDVFSELVERRLWPVALVLVLALVAVPVLLAKSSAPEDAGEPAAPSPAAVAAAAATADLRTPDGPVVRVAEGAGPRAALRGEPKNPFRQQYVAPPEQLGSLSAGAAGTTSGTGDAAGGDGTGTDGTGVDGDEQPTYVYATIDLRFGHAGRALRTFRDVPRLAPLPRTTKPVVIFLGMRDDRETAVFMVSTDVRVQGLGRCVPSPKLCEAIELRRDDVVFLDYTEADGTVVQYELELVDVELHETTSEEIARQAYARASSKGRRLLRGQAATSSVAGMLRYSPRTGVLIARPGSYLTRAGRSAAQRSQRVRASAGTASHAPVLTPLP